MENGSTRVKHQIKMMMLLLGTIAVTSNAFAQNDKAVKYGMTTGRMESILIGVLGIISLILSIRYSRSSKKVASPNKRRGIVIAGLLGLICILLAGIHIANSTGGFGSGGGKAGAIVAIVLGLIATVLSSIALARFRHAGN